MSYAREYALRPAVATEVVHLLDSTDESLREDEPDVATPVMGAVRRPQIPALSSDNSPSRWRRWLILGALGAVCVSAALVGLNWFREQGPAPTQPLIFHTVTPGQLPITVTERGNLESQSNIEILCEVDDIEGDGVLGTQIISIVPNGTSVKEGETLVEFDKTGHQERLDRQILDTEEARATQIQAQAKYENQITQNETLAGRCLAGSRVGETRAEDVRRRAEWNVQVGGGDDRTADRGHQQRNPRGPGEPGTEDERETGNRDAVQAGVRRQAPTGPKPNWICCRRKVSTRPR